MLNTNEQPNNNQQQAAQARQAEQDEKQKDFEFISLMQDWLNNQGVKCD